MVLTSTAIKDVQDKIELAASKTNSSQHTRKSACLGIHKLAHFLARDSIRLNRSGRGCDLEASDVLGVGAQLLPKAVKGLNNKVFYDSSM